MIKKYCKFLIPIFIIAFSLFACEEDLPEDDGDLRTQLEGTWGVYESNNMKSTENYTVTIYKSISDSTAIRINNFYNVNETINAVITESNFDVLTVTIPQQNASSFTIQGGGSISSNRQSIQLSYTVDYNNGFTDQVMAVYSKLP